ncbi:hypothetical protein F53441_7198 [Fusarium austroafricanum]|uniref:Transposase Tc1-like domain-containing protein n=1 Tax=Fusarium austroafricanum TaxID=2364996 RepID=A0A8H4KH13_9HYPO|nr:hypothetical protein F53441_7198 [Fusarium austroafricanum]
MAETLQEILSSLAGLEHEQATRSKFESSNNAKLEAIKRSISHYSNPRPHLEGEDTQIVQNVMQVEQLRRAVSMPSHVQRSHAAHLHAQGWSKQAVAEEVKWTLPLTRAATRVSAVPISTNYLSTRGRPSPPTIVQARELVQFVKSSPHARRMPLAKIAVTIGLECTERDICNALGRRGFKLYPAIIRPFIDKKARELRLDFALKHVNWTVEQWNKVLFYAEVRIPLSNDREALVIRQSDESFHPDCINDEPIPPTTCDDNDLFFAHFSGLSGKGPLMSWNRLVDKKFGILSPENHYKIIFPGFGKWVDKQPPGARFAMVPDLPSHSAVAIKDDIRSRFMPVEHFPPASPDLNPITEMFNVIKAALKTDRDNSLFGDVDDRRIRQVVRGTWNSMSDEYMHELIASMSRRCQAVIDANGSYTRY